MIAQSLEKSTEPVSSHLFHSYSFFLFLNHIATTIFKRMTNNHYLHLT